MLMNHSFATSPPTSANIYNFGPPQMPMLAAPRALEAHTLRAVKIEPCQHVGSSRRKHAQLVYRVARSDLKLEFDPKLCQHIHRAIQDVCDLVVHHGRPVPSLRSPFFRAESSAGQQHINNQLKCRQLIKSALVAVFQTPHEIQLALDFLCGRVTLADDVSKQLILTSYAGLFRNVVLLVVKKMQQSLGEAFTSTACACSAQTTATPASHNNLQPSKRKSATKFDDSKKARNDGVFGGWVSIDTAMPAASTQGGVAKVLQKLVASTISDEEPWNTVVIPSPFPVINNTRSANDDTCSTEEVSNKFSFFRAFCTARTVPSMTKLLTATDTVGTQLATVLGKGKFRIRHNWFPSRLHDPCPVSGSGSDATRNSYKFGLRWSSLVSRESADALKQLATNYFHDICRQLRHSASTINTSTTEIVDGESKQQIGLHLHFKHVPKAGLEHLRAAERCVQMWMADFETITAATRTKADSQQSVDDAASATSSILRFSSDLPRSTSSRPQQSGKASLSKDTVIVDL